MVRSWLLGHLSAGRWETGAPPWCRHSSRSCSVPSCPRGAVPSRWPARAAHSMGESGAMRTGPHRACRVKARKRLSWSCQEDSCQVMSWVSRNSARPSEGWLRLNLIMLLRHTDAFSSPAGMHGRPGHAAGMLAELCSCRLPGACRRPLACARAQPHSSREECARRAA